MKINVPKILFLSPIIEIYNTPISKNNSYHFSHDFFIGLSSVCILDLCFAKLL